MFASLINLYFQLIAASDTIIPNSSFLISKKKSPALYSPYNNMLYHYT